MVDIKTHRSVQDSVYTNLRKNIMNLHLAPGTAISEKEISVRYKVSRTPVRETFIHLAKEGLVKVIPQKETLVSLIDFSRVDQECFLRTNLEIGVLKPFIKNQPEKYFSYLEELITYQGNAFKHNDPVDFLKYDDAFHKTFFEGAHQELSWEVLESMSGHYHRARLLTVKINEITEDIIKGHRDLFSAIKKKDFHGALTILSKHLHKLDAEEKILREKFPEYFLPREQKDDFDIDFSDPPPRQRA